MKLVSLQEKEETRAHLLSLYHITETVRGVICKLGRGTSPEPNLAGPPVSYFQPPELCDDEFLWLSHPVCGICFLITDQAD